MLTLAALFLAFAQQTAPGTAAAPVPAPAAPSSKTVSGVTVSGSAGEVVCKRDAVTGSRLQAPKVCRTRGEWADMSAQAREATQQVQNQRSGGPR